MWNYNYSDRPSWYSDGVVVKKFVAAEGVSSIGNFFFYRGGNQVETVILPQSLRSIGENAFFNCTTLTDLTIPEGVTSLKGNAFGDCKALTRLSLPSTLTTVGSAAFYHTENLARVDITDLDAWCRIQFSDRLSSPFNASAAIGSLYCNGEPVTEVTIPADLDCVGKFQFYGCNSLQKVRVPEGITKVDEEAFLSCHNLSKVTLADTVTSVGRRAFSGCGSLTDLWMPLSLTEIGNEAFRNCAGLGAITLPEGLRAIGEYTFAGCTAMDTTLPGTLTGMGQYAFQNCSSLKDAIIPDGVTVIQPCTFDGCSGMEVVDIPDSVTSLGNFAFRNCGVRSLSLSENLTEIPYSAFYGCGRLEHLIIPDSVTMLEPYAFQNCGALQDISFSSRLKKIGSYCFENCASLTAIVLPPSLTTLDMDAFRGCSSLQDVTLSVNLTGISERAFSGCSSLTYIIIPEGVTGIGFCAFNNAALTDVYLPESLTGIAEKAFWNCSKIKDIWYAGSPRQWASITKGSYNSAITGGTATIHCAKNPIPLGTYCIHVMDENGVSLKGASVHWDSEEKTTDQAGNVYFALTDGSSPAVTVAQPGYLSWNNLTGGWTKSTTRYDEVILYPVSAGPYKLKSARYSNSADMSPSHNLLTGRKVVSLANTGHLVGDLDFGHFYLTCAAMEDENVLLYELWQTNRMIKASSNGDFGQLSVESFRKGGGCFIRVRTTTGELIDNPIQLEFAENTVVPSSGCSLSTGKISFMAGDDVPFLGGRRVEIDLPVQSPVAITTTGEKIMIGINLALQDDEEAVKQFLDYKQLLWQSFAAGSIDVSWVNAMRLNKYLAGHNKARLLGDCDITYAGYLECDAGEVTASGYLFILVNPEMNKNDSLFRFEQNLLVSVVPVTVQVGLDLSLQAGGELHYGLLTGEWDGNLLLNPTLGLQAFGGIGYSTAVGVGVYGKGELALKWNVLGTEPGIRAVDLTGELGVKAYLGPAAYEKSFAHNTWYLYTAAPVAGLASAGTAWQEELADASRYETADLGYLAEESPWLGNVSAPSADGGQVRPALLEDGSAKTELTPLLTETYRNARPVMISDGSALYAAFVRADENGSRYVACAKFDGTSWSSPVRTDENAVLDDSPVLCVDDSGNVWLAYARTTEWNDGMNLSAYAKNQEIVAGRLNKDTLALTDSRVCAPTGQNGFLHLQQLAVVNGTPILAWAETAVTDDNSVLSPAEGAIFCASYENGAWGETIRLTEAAAEQLSVGEYDGKPAVAYTEDGVLSCVTTEGTAAQLAQNVTGKVTYGTFPGTEQRAFLWNGADVLTSSLNQSAEAAGITGEYTVLGDSIYYSAAGESSANLTVLRHSESGWGLPIRLTDGDGYLENLSAAVLNGEDYVFGMRTSPEITETGVTDSKDLVWSKVLPVSDLRLDDISYDGEGVAAGDEVPVTLTVTNAGDHTVTGVEITRGETPLAPAECALAPGNSLEINVSLICPDTLTGYTFKVSEPGRTDYADGDNTGTLRLGYADVSTALTYQQIGEKRYLLATVTNEGIETASGTVFFLDSNEETVWSSGFDSLSGGAMTAIRYEIPDGSAALAEGEVSVRAQIDQEELFTYNNGSTILLSMLHCSVENLAVNGETVTADVYCDDTKGAVALCAAYAENGRLLSVRAEELTANGLNAVTFPLAGSFDHIKVFVVDANGAPLCANGELKK